jgi:hypothetical protein
VATKPLPNTDFTRDGAERLALAQLELERIEAACRFDRCEADCRVRAAALASVEAVRLAYRVSTGVVA